MQEAKRKNSKWIISMMLVLLSFVIIGYVAPVSVKAASPQPLTITINTPNDVKKENLVVTLKKDGVETQQAQATSGEYKFSDVSSFVTADQLTGTLLVGDDLTKPIYQIDLDLTVNTQGEFDSQTYYIPTKVSGTAVSENTGLTYNGAEQELVKVENLPNTFKIEYAEKNTDGTFGAYSNTTPSRKDAGTYTFGTKITYSDNEPTRQYLYEYNEITTTIAKKNVSLALTGLEDTVVLADGAKNFTVEGTDALEAADKSKIKVNVNSSDTDVATISEAISTYKITPLLKGTTDISVSLENESGETALENYASSPATKTVTVSNPVTLEFTEKNKSIKWYEADFDLSFKPGKSNPIGTNLIYDSTDPTVASVGATGKVTLHKPGTVTLTATLSDLDKATYDVTDATYELTVIKANSDDVSLSFATQPESATPFKDSPNNTLEYRATATFKDNAKLKSQKNQLIINYTVENDLPSGTTVNGAKVTYKNTGNLTVVAKATTNDYFDESITKSYTTNITAFTPTKKVTLENVKYQNGTYYCWDNDATVKAPDGYTIAKTTDADGNTIKDNFNWAGSIVYTGTTSKVFDPSELKYLLKKTDDSTISTVQAISDTLAIDQDKPEVTSFTLSATNTSPVAKLINNLSFGLFFNQEIKVTVNSKDIAPSSKIKEVVLNSNGSSVGKKGTETINDVKSNDNSEGKTEFIISDDRFTGSISAIIMDNAGNTITTEATSSNTTIDKSLSVDGKAITINGANTSAKIIIDKTNEGPAVTNLSFVQNDKKNPVVIGTGAEAKFFISDKGTFSFNVQDPYTGLNAVKVKVNGTAYECTSIDKEMSTTSSDIESHRCTYDLDIKTMAAKEDGSYVLSVVATNNSGYTTEETMTLYKDVTTPIITDFKYNPTTIPLESGNTAPVEDNKNAYGFYVDKETTVTISAVDLNNSNEAASGVKSITYEARKADGKASTIKGTLSVTDNTISVKVAPDFKGKIYAYATDNMEQSTKAYKEKEDSSLMTLPTAFDEKTLGTDGYLHSSGLIVESLTEHQNSSKITIENNNTSDDYVTKWNKRTEEATLDADMVEKESEPVYTALNNLTFDLKVEDTCSGIKSIKTKVYSGNTPLDKYTNTTTVNQEGKIVEDNSIWKIDEGGTDENLVTKVANKAKLELAKEDLVGTTNQSFAVVVILTDNAGNKTYSYSPFSIDKTKPVVQKSAVSIQDTFLIESNSDSLINNILNNLGFGFFLNNDIKVTVNTYDQSPSSGITKSGITKGQISLVVRDKDGDEKSFKAISKTVKETKLHKDDYSTYTSETFSVPTNFKGYLIAKVVDNAGNISEEVKAIDKNTQIKASDDTIVNLKNAFGLFGIESLEEHLGTENNASSSIVINDSQAAKCEYTTSAVENPFDQSISQTVAGKYNADTALKVYTGEDNLTFPIIVTDSYSYIRSVDVRVYNGSSSLEEITECAYSESFNTGNEGKAEWTKEFKITADKLRNTSFKDQTFFIKVILTDNAGNQSYNYYPFAIDRTSPTFPEKATEDENAFKIEKTGDWLYNATFGLFGHEKIKITVTTYDEKPSAGISSTEQIKVYGKKSDSSTEEIQLTEGGFTETKKTSADNQYRTVATKTYTIDPDFEGYLFAVVTDNAGNVSKTIKATEANTWVELKKSQEKVEGSSINEDGYIMLETKAPVFDENKIIQTTGLNRNQAPTTLNDKLYISGDASLTVAFKDEQSGINNVIVQYTRTDAKGNLTTTNLGTDYVTISGTSESHGQYNKGGFYDFSGERDNKEHTLTINTQSISGETPLLPSIDGKMTFKVTFVDNAGNSTSLEQSVYKDITSASINSFDFEPINHDGESPTNYFGFFINSKTRITIGAEDVKFNNEAFEAVTGLKNNAIHYKAISVEDNKIKYEGDINSGGSFIVEPDFKGFVYAYAVDKMGQSGVTYVVSQKEIPQGPMHMPQRFKYWRTFDDEGFVHPSGSIIESPSKHLATSTIEISAPSPVNTEDHASSYNYGTLKDSSAAYDEGQLVPLYNGGFTFGVNVTDTYSGIRSVKYTVIEGGADQATSTVTVNNEGELDNSQWTTNKTDNNLVTGIGIDIPVNGNHNDMVLRIDLEDRAGNVSYDYYMFGIDTTAPTIDVTYDNNNGDSIGAKAANHSYFNANRTATIVVTERNFDSSRVNIHATKNGAEMPVGVSWSRSEGSGNGDGSTNVATITYSDDADYTFTMDCTDRATNRNTAINYGGSLTPENFTVDKTAPVVTVTYDNNNAANSKYFNANRVATITVGEHNMDLGRIKVPITASLDGQGISVPGVSWGGVSDTTVGTVAFNTDGDYTLNVTELRDMAGNSFAGANYSATAAQDFTVDTKIEKPVFRGIENGKAYKDDFAIGFDALDINFDTDKVQLLRTRWDVKDEDVTSQFLTNISRSSHGDVADGNTIAKERDYDGIYTLNVSLTDKATNTESATITFSVNRYGSVYVFDSYLTSLMNNYVKKVDKGLVITEYNPDRLIANSIKLQATRDTNPIQKLKSSVSPVPSASTTIGNSGWYEYRYTIDAANFAKDGIYGITVSSQDEAGNEPQNTNFTDKSINFRVDSVKPELTSITGLESDTINAVSQDVEFKTFDSIGLASVTVTVNGKAIEKVNSFEDLTSYSGHFTMNEGVRQNVAFIIKDKAGNILDTSKDEFNPSYAYNSVVTISTNFFVRWFSNTGRTVGTIAGGCGIAAVLVFLLLKKTKKNDADVESTK